MKLSKEQFDDILKIVDNEIKCKKWLKKDKTFLTILLNNYPEFSYLRQENFNMKKCLEEIL